MNQWMWFYLIFFFANASLSVYNLLEHDSWIVFIVRFVLVAYSLFGFIYEWRKKDEYL